jgi:hypothetical protein
MPNSKGHKLIFEGVELSGKSFLIHQVYDFLEKKYNSKRHILDGCHWFNSDIGIFGTNHSQEIIEKYVEMAEILKDRNVIFEKLFLSDQIYHEIDSGIVLNYRMIEERLLNLGAKVILCFVKNDEKIFEERLKVRISLYAHYGRINRKPKDYLKIQRKFLERAETIKLPILKVDLTDLPQNEALEKILNWIGEKDR